MASLSKITDLKQGDIFSFDENGLQYTVHRKGIYKMLLNDGTLSFISFHYFIYFKPIYHHGYDPEIIAKPSKERNATFSKNTQANFIRFSNA